MPRKPIQIVMDFEGTEWDVFEIRDTPHPFPIFLGRPSERKGAKRGGNAVILTVDLAAFLEKTRRGHNLAELKIPVGKAVITRLRRELGMNRYADARAWWESRVTDLGSMTLEAFAEKHGVTSGAAANWRLELIGKTNRDNGWYREEAAKEALLSSLPTGTVATFLGVAKGTVSSIRSKLKGEGDEIPVPAKIRQSENHKGIPISPERRKKFAKMASKPWSERRKAARSADARERYLRDGVRPRNPNAPDWTPEEDAILGTTTDRQASIQLGRPIHGVRGRRKALGIKQFRAPWQMPVPRSELAIQLSRIVVKRYESISGAVQATGIKYSVLHSACTGRKGLLDSTLDSILATLKATRRDLENTEAPA